MDADSAREGFELIVAALVIRGGCGLLFYFERDSEALSIKMMGFNFSKKLIQRSLGVPPCSVEGRVGRVPPIVTSVYLLRFGG